MPFQPPVVDGLSVRVVVDSRYERFLPKASHPLVQVEHIGRIRGRPDMTLAAEWGLSLHLDSEKAGAKAQYVPAVCCPAPRALEGAFTSGYIERTSFEEVTGGSWVEDDHYSEAERKGKLVRDQHPDEHATCYIVKGRGLVVISSCGHSGIVNTVKSAMAAANVDKVHAVIGGFHLGTSPKEYLQHSLQELERINPDVILPMHCTGEPFIAMLRERLPDKVVYSNVGSRFTFGA